jgi:hypothetical protein
LVPVLFKFYIQGVLKLKKNNSGAKRLSLIAYNVYSNDRVVLICETHALFQIVILNTKKTCKKRSRECDKEGIIRETPTVRTSPLYEVWFVDWTGCFLKCLEQRKICFENYFWAIGIYVICRQKRQPLEVHWLCGAKPSFPLEMLFYQFLNNSPACYRNWRPIAVVTGHQQFILFRALSVHLSSSWSMSVRIT